MSLNEDGFLSGEILKFQRIIGEKYARQLDLVKRINRFCQKKKMECSIHIKDGQEVLAACLMMKLLDDVQAAIFLVERGMAPQARQLLRAGVENLIILRNVCEREEFFRQYVFAGENQRLKLINGIKHCPKPSFNELRKDITDELIEDVKNLISGEDFSPASLKNLAEAVHMEELYEGFYRLLSPEVHSSPKSLERYMVWDEGGHLKNFSWGPVTSNLESVFALAVMLMLVCLETVAKLFELDIEREVVNFQSEYDGWNNAINQEDS